MIKKFNEVAFSLTEGEISDPFETEYGFFIIYLEKIRGQEYDIRTILLRPKINNKEIEDTRKRLLKIRERIVNDEISFADAAIDASDEIETRNNGGLLINPETQDYKFKRR